MVVTDLDGTLLREDRTVSERDYRTLLALGGRGLLRVIATGRSLFSARKVLCEDFPIDYLVFSSGAGVMDWPRQRLLQRHSLRRAQVEAAFRVLKAQGLDFMVHRPVPDNHYFTYFCYGRDNPDFRRRCELYREFASPGKEGELVFAPASQLLAVKPPPILTGELEALNEALRPLKVIRATSPLDGESLWIEIFSPQVSKARAGAWLAARHGLARRDVLALGNDYNDLDLLRWAGCSFVVGNAPQELKEHFPSVCPHNQSGFTEAVSRWSGLAL